MQFTELTGIRLTTRKTLDVLITKPSVNNQNKLIALKIALLYICNNITYDSKIEEMYNTLMAERLPWCPVGDVVTLDALDPASYWPLTQVADITTSLSAVVIESDSEEGSEDAEGEVAEGEVAEGAVAGEEADEGDGEEEVITSAFVIHSTE